MKHRAPQNENVDPGAVKAGIVFHDRLNPKLWVNDDMRLDVRTHLLEAALQFYEFLDVPDLKIIDVIFTGSNASYNYTKYSDCDVHIIVNYDRTASPPLAENLFSTKKALWGKTRNVMVNGYPVELYVEDTKNPVHALGVYDLLTGEWIKHPTPTKPDWDDDAVLRKTDHLADEIEALIANNASADDMAAMMARIRRMRQAGLADGGEFSTENLAFKTLRNIGLLDQLYAAMLARKDTDISL